MQISDVLNAAKMAEAAGDEDAAFKLNQYAKKLQLMYVPDEEQTAPLVKEEPKPEEGIWAALKGTLATEKNAISTAFSAITGNADEAAKKGVMEQALIDAKYKHGADTSTAWKMFKDGNYVDSLKELASQAPNMLVDLAPMFAEVAAGTAAGAAAGSVFGGVGALPGAVIGGAGAFAARMPTHFGERLQQDAAKDIAEGKEVDVDALRAAGYAAAGSALDLPLAGALKGARYLGKGASEAEKLAAAAKIAEEGRAMTALKGAARFNAEMAPIGAAGVALDRSFRDEDIIGEGSGDEYGQALISSLPLSPLGMMHRSSEKTSARAKLKEESDRVSAEEALKESEATKAAEAEAAALEEARKQTPEYAEQIINDYRAAEEKKIELQSQLREISQESPEADKLFNKDIEDQLAQHQTVLEELAKEHNRVSQLEFPQQEEAPIEPAYGTPEIRDALTNPVGNFTPDQLGPEVTKWINTYRRKSNLPALNEYSIEDVKSAMTRVNPKGEQAALDSLLTQRMDYTGAEKYTPENIFAKAQEKNIKVDNHGFESFLHRVTGTDDIAEMSQPQLHAAFKALDAIPAHEAPQILPSHSNATHFSERQYNDAVNRIKLETAGKEVTLPDAMSMAKQATMLRSEEDVAALLRKAKDSGDLNVQPKDVYHLVNDQGNRVTTVDNPELAQRISNSQNLQIERGVSHVISVPEKAEGTSTPRVLPKIEVVSGDTVLHATTSQDIANTKAETFKKIRSAQAKTLEGQISELQSKMTAGDKRIDAMEANGKFGTPEHERAVITNEANKKAIQTKISELTAKKEALAAPIGFRVAQEKPKVAERVEPLKTAEPIQPPSAEEKALHAQLRKVLDGFGMHDIALNIEKAMKGANGSYINSVIKVAMTAQNPLRVLRHESVHGLHDLGFFTDGQWNMLKNQADKVWINEFLKKRNVSGEALKPGEKSRYERYQELYGKNNLEAIREEAIADAFAHFDINGAPKGVFAALINKLKSFLHSLANAYEGYGFDTAEGVFKRVERGELKKTREGGGTPTKPNNNKAKLNAAPDFAPEHIWRLHEAARRADDEASGNAPLRQNSEGRVPRPADLKRNQVMTFRRLEKAVSDHVGNDWNKANDLMVRMNEESGRRESGEKLSVDREVHDDLKKAGVTPEMAEQWLKIQDHYEKNNDIFRYGEGQELASVRRVRSRMMGKFVQFIKEAGLDPDSGKYQHAMSLRHMKGESLFKEHESGEKFSIFDNAPNSIKAMAQNHTRVRDNDSLKARAKEMLGFKGASYFREKAINKVNRIGEYEHIYAKLKGLDRVRLADSNAEAAALMSDLSSGVAAAVMGLGKNKGGIPVYKNGYTTTDTSVKGLVELLSPLAKYKDPQAFRYYQLWSIAKREKNLPKDKRAMSDADIQEAINYGNQFPEFKQVQADWIKYNDGIVKYLEDTGVVSKEGAEAMREHADYVPFYRQLDEDESIGPKLSYSLANVKGPKKLKGGQDAAPVADFLENAVRNTQSAIAAGMRNVAGVKAVELAVEIGQAEKLNHLSTKEHAVNVLVNGKKVSYECYDPLFINAVKSLNAGELPFMGLLAGPANFLRSMVTKDPGFMIANMMRDSMDAYIRSGTNMVPVVDTLKNFGNALFTRSPVYEALYNAGILGGYELSTGLKASARALAKDIRKKTGTLTAGEKAASPFTGIWDALERTTEASDAATRMKVYEETMKKTGNEAEALFQSLELMNFHRKGSSLPIRVLTAAIPFLNARVQGLDALYRGGIKPMLGGDATAHEKQIAKTFAVRAMTLMALSTMYAAAMSGDPDYEKQEEEVRDNNWLIGGIKIPIPFEIGTVFKTIPERIYRLTLGKDTSRDFNESMVRALTSTLQINFIPQTALPVVENITNHSFFTGREIVPGNMKNLDPAYQFGPSTSLWAQNLGKELGWSPAKIDHLFQGYAGTMGGYASAVIDSVIDTQSKTPAKRFEQMPFVKRFVVDPDARGNISAFYDMKNEVDMVVRTINDLQRVGDPDLPEYAQKHEKLYAAKSFISGLNKQIDNMNQQSKMIRASDMRPEEKRDALLEITRAQNNLLNDIRAIRKVVLAND